MDLKEEPINLPVGQNDGRIVYLDLIEASTWHTRFYDILILSYLVWNTWSMNDHQELRESMIGKSIGIFY